MNIWIIYPNAFLLSKPFSLETMLSSLPWVLITTFTGGSLQLMDWRIALHKMSRLDIITAILTFLHATRGSESNGF